jgi:hypothetical protein
MRQAEQSRALEDPRPGKRPPSARKPEPSTCDRFEHANSPTTAHGGRRQLGLIDTVGVAGRLIKPSASTSPIEQEFLV